MEGWLSKLWGGYDLCTKGWSFMTFVLKGGHIPLFLTGLKL